MPRATLGANPPEAQMSAKLGEILVRENLI